jgi:GDP-4-dehydro-6-deoxy-D-mannose reductase
VRILITGIGGFVGSHLWRHLLSVIPDSEIHGLTLALPASPDSSIHYHTVDLKDAAALTELVADLQPQQVYHLAAQSSPARSLRPGAAWTTLENNIRSQLNLLDACLTVRPTPRILIISSGEIYYGAVQQHELPLDENAPFRPTNPYSVSKVTQDMMALQYYLSHRMPIIRARPFNHSGPGQSEGFVAPDFAIQIARIESGQQEPFVAVGNLTAQRDFTDARDVVRAYQLLMQHGVPGEVYNVASGNAHSTQELLDTLLQYSDPAVRERIEVRVDHQRWRPVDVPLIRGDASTLRHLTGWQPHITFEQMLLDLLDDCRQRIRVSAQH